MITVPRLHVSGMSLVLAVMLTGGRLVFPGSDKGHSGAAKDEVWKGFWPGTVLDSIRSNKNNAALLLVAANTLVIIPAILHAIVDKIFYDDFLECIITVEANNSDKLHLASNQPVILK